MRRLLIPCLLAAPLAAGLPGWWSAFPKVAALESRFRQQSDSAVFGKIAREGTLVLARGGRLRVAYDRGLILTCDGRYLVQFDPDTQTAQRMDVPRALREFPLLGVLSDPSKLDRVYRVESAGGEAVKLVPKEKGVPEVLATGQGGLLRSLSWTDATGARQTLELLNPRSGGAPKADLFRPSLPKGTRWATRNG